MLVGPESNSNQQQMFKGKLNSNEPLSSSLMKPFINPNKFPANVVPPFSVKVIDQMEAKPSLKRPSLLVSIFLDEFRPPDPAPLLLSSLQGLL